MTAVAHTFIYGFSLFLVSVYVYRWVIGRFFRLRRPVIFAVMLSGLVMWAGFPYFRGYAGEISVTTVLILLLEIFPRPRFSYFSKGYGWGRGAWGIVVMGLLLYPSVLFMTPWYAYGWGYPDGPNGWLMLLVVLAVGSYWWWRRSWLAALLPLGVAAYWLGLLESNNLWDYLIDPLVFLWALAVILLNITRRFLSHSLTGKGEKAKIVTSENL